MPGKKPIVLDENGEPQQLQAGEELTIEDQINYQRILIRKLILFITEAGIEVDKQLEAELELL